MLIKLIKEDKKLNVKEYSKTWMNKWQYFVMFWCAVFFASDIYFNHAEHCVELCITLVTSVAATFVVYLPKAYFSKRNEEFNNMVSNGIINMNQEDEDNGGVDC